jgi:glycosyltransferase involved in cell wall biosynthesis
MKIAIIGTRGIPNRYGGFEQLAEQLSVGLVQKGYAVTVYNSHQHPYRESKFKGIDIVHCYDAENWLGSAGQFIYDLNCIRDARKKKFDVLLFLGYTSSSVWRRLYPGKTLVISNMDGLEWKRSKYSKPVKRFLQYAEKLAVRHSDFLIADSAVIQSYLQNKYNVASQFIPYGAEIINDTNEKLLSGFNVSAKKYYMLMARIEPENNIEMILDGFHLSQSDKQFIVVGNTKNNFGKKMMKKFEVDKRIHFVDAIYDNRITHALRAFCSLYFHGHSVGGTNPSLLEAMADGCLVAAHDNEFNHSVLQDDGFYFSSPTAVLQLVEHVNTNPSMIENNLAKIRTQYNWPAIVNQYDEFITESYNRLQQ